MGPPLAPRLLLWGAAGLIAFLLVLPTLVMAPSTDGSVSARPAAPAQAPSLAGSARTLAPAIGPLDPSAVVHPRSGGIGQLVVTTPDSAVVPNDGLQVNLSVYSSPALPAGSSFQIGAEEQIGSYEAVMGLFANTATAPVPFFSVFLLRNDSNVHLAYWPSLSLSVGETLAFVLTPTDRTNWSVTINGQLFGGNATDAQFDFGAALSTSATNLSFSETAIFSATSTSPSRLDVPVAFAVHTQGRWYLPLDGATEFTGGAGTQWGVEGRIQRPTLAPGELQTGSGVANVTNGTLVWSGGTVPILVAVSVGLGTVRGLTTIPWTISTNYPSGGVVPNVAVVLTDSLNGTFLPPGTFTGISGVAAGLFAVPNVSSSVVDTVHVAVTTLGYAGTGNETLLVLPPIAVSFVVSPASPSLAPGQNLEITFGVRSANGTPLSGVTVLFAASGGAGLSTLVGVTGPSGTIGVVLFAPTTATELKLNASVDSEGYWGTTSVSVHVGASTPTFYQTYGTLIVLIGVTATVVAAAVIVLRERRRRRQPIPEMGIRRYLLEERRRRPPNRPTTGEAETPPPVTRTPP